MNNVIFIAPPAAGKGTFSTFLVEMGYTHISTGDLLREEMAKNSEIGISIKDIMNEGKLVSDEIVYELLNKKIKSLNGLFVLDGYPRNLNQAETLDSLFNELNIDNYKVVYLDLGVEEALKRALGRVVCSCGRSYNVNSEMFKPKVQGICDDCGKELTLRGDDNEESFKVRFATFLENIEPIRDYYNNKNKLYIVDVTVGVDEVMDKIKKIIAG